jgi:hypothetical protein
VEVPILSKAQVVWQQGEGEPRRYQSGLRLVGLSAAIRTQLEEVIAKHTS